MKHINFQKVDGCSLILALNSRLLCHFEIFAYLEFQLFIIINHKRYISNYINL